MTDAHSQVEALGWEHSHLVGPHLSRADQGNAGSWAKHLCGPIFLGSLQPQLPLLLMSPPRINFPQICFSAWIHLPRNHSEPRSPSVQKDSDGTSGSQEMTPAKCCV